MCTMQYKEYSVLSMRSIQDEAFIAFSQCVCWFVQHPVKAKAVVWQPINPERCWMDSWLDLGLACLPLPQVTNPSSSCRMPSNEVCTIPRVEKKGKERKGKERKGKERKGKGKKRKEKIRKDYAFRRQCNEKPSLIPGCPGPKSDTNRHSQHDVSSNQQSTCF